MFPSPRSPEAENFTPSFVQLIFTESPICVRSRHILWNSEEGMWTTASYSWSYHPQKKIIKANDFKKWKQVSFDPPYTFSSSTLRISSSPSFHTQILQNWAGPWHLPFALRWLGNHSFSQKSYGHRFRAMGSLAFFLDYTHDSLEADLHTFPLTIS